MKIWEEKYGGRYKAKRENERKLKSFAVAKKRQAELAHNRKFVIYDVKSLIKEYYDL